MTRMLVVASETLSPLSTAMPLPTDGQPEWCICSGFADRHERLPRLCSAGLADGPFPFTVAVWREAVRCPSCEQEHVMGEGWPSPDDHMFCDRALRLFGAVVATVEVTDPGHHADECLHRTGETGVELPASDFCHPDADIDGWHTPTSTVTRLNVPIPTERPTVYSEEAFIASLDDHRPGDIPASWWWVGLDLEVPA